jgi:phosphopantothenoylcysteine decarboxylase / phosphopantothenate---cysteine ligase
LITAGPTHENIDPVRFVSNHSSGKMGYALAAAAAEAGADVVLVSGPVTLTTPAGVRRIDASSALDMHNIVMHEVRDADIFIACAAVADYRLAEPAATKLKKTADTLELKMVRNPDILAEVAALPNAPFTLGFAAETDNLRDNALIKLKQKGLNMIAANQVGAGLGFAADDNALQVYWADGSHEFARTPKTKLARQLIALLAERYTAGHTKIQNEKTYTTENS